MAVSMEYILTKHANERMEERYISKRLLESALNEPTKLSYDRKGNVLLKKIYKKKDKKRLLLVVVERLDNKVKVITIIDTSKIKKYL